MDVTFKKEKVPVSRLCINEKESLLVEGDMIVPDIKPDIGEILLTEANSVVTDYVAEKGRLTYSGQCQVKILYLPEGEAGDPKCIETILDFKESMALPGVEDAHIRVKAETEHIEFSLIHSRKLNVKVVVSVCVSGHETREMTLLTEAEGGLLRTKKEALSLYQISADTCRELVLEESIEVPATKPDIDEILKVYVKAVKGNCKIMAGKILLKGSLIVHTLYCGMEEESRVESMEHELPFSEMLDISDLDESCLCHVSYDVKTVSYSIKSDLNGDPRLISLDVVLRAGIIASKNRELGVIGDCYSIEGPEKPQWETWEIDELLSEGTSYETVKEILNVKEGMPSMDGIYSLQCKPYIYQTEIKQGQIEIKSKLIVFILYGNGEGEKALYSLVREIDFTHTLPVEGLDRDSLCECNVTDQNVSFTLNGGSELELRCTLEYYTRAIRKKEVSLLCGCTISEEAETENQELVIYFTRPGDNLWDIAKHYRRDEEKIRGANHLEGEALSPGQKLLIPKN